MTTQKDDARAKALRLEITIWDASADDMERRAALRAVARVSWNETEDGRRRYKSMGYSATKRIKRARAHADYLRAQLAQIEHGSPAERAARIKDAAAGADILAQL